MADEHGKSGVEFSKLKQLEEELNSVQDNYDSLFNHMLDGYAHCKMVYDNQGNPIDFIYLNVNEAFKRLTGLYDVVGKKVSEAIPGTKETHPELLEIYNRVASTGDPERFEIEFKPLNLWLNIAVHRPQKHHFIAIFENITERKKAEQMLVESENRYHMVADFTYNWEEWLNTNRELEYVSPSCERITGYTAQEFMNNPNLIFQIIHPDDRNLFKIHLKEEFSSNESQSVIFRIINRDGKINWIEHICQPVYDNDGQFMGRRGSNRDITTRQQMEKKMLRHQAEIQTLFEYTPAGMVLFDGKPPYTVLIHNKYYQEFFAEPFYSKGIVGLNIYDYTPKVEAEGVVAVFDEVVRTKKTVEYLDFPYKSNYPNQSWFDWYMSPVIIDDKVVALVSMSLDVTARHKLEEAFKGSEEKYRSLYTSMNEGVALHEIIYNSQQKAVDYIITDVNPAYETITGLKRDEVVGKKASELYNTGTPPYIEFYVPVAETGEQTEFDTYFEPMDKYFHISVTSPGKGKFATVFEDITKHKKAEKLTQELLEKEKQLSEEVQVTNEELMNSQDELREIVNKLETSNEELEQFAYVASHDLQEPLRMISSFTQLLERRYKDKLDKDADEYIEIIVEGAQRMKNLIDDLLEFSRLNTTAREFKLVSTHLILDEVLSNLSTFIEENNAKITYKHLITISGDSSQLKQLFQNLIINAIKFHGKNPPIIYISAKEYKNGFLFSVSDNGIGIDPKNQKKIFNVFNRLHTRDEYPGTGIGLAICKRIVERHGGKIWVESEPDKGSTFYFNIPNRNGYPNS